MNKFCEKCGKKFKTYPCRVKIGAGKFCSPKCANAGKTPSKYWTEEGKKRIALAHTGSKNSNWKGNQVGLRSLHRWVRNRFPQPKCCMKCGKITRKLDLANKGTYRRDLSQWEYLCRRCHLISDGRLLSNLIKINGPMENVEYLYESKNA